MMMYDDVEEEREKKRKKIKKLTKTLKIKNIRVSCALGYIKNCLIYFI